MTSNRADDDRARARAFPPAIFFSTSRHSTRPSTGATRRLAAQPPDGGRVASSSKLACFVRDATAARHPNKTGQPEFKAATAVKWRLKAFAAARLTMQTGDGTVHDSASIKQGIVVTASCEAGFIFCARTAETTRTADSRRHSSQATGKQACVRALSALYSSPRRDRTSVTN